MIQNEFDGMFDNGNLFNSLTSLKCCEQKSLVAWKWCRREGFCRWSERTWKAFENVACYIKAKAFWQLQIRLGMTQMHLIWPMKPTNWLSKNFGITTEFKKGTRPNISIKMYVYVFVCKNRRFCLFIHVHLFDLHEDLRQNRTPTVFTIHRWMLRRGQIEKKNHFWSDCVGFDGSIDVIRRFRKGRLVNNKRQQQRFLFLFNGESLNTISCFVCSLAFFLFLKCLHRSKKKTFRWKEQWAATTTKKCFIEKVWGDFRHVRDNNAEMLTSMSWTNINFALQTAVTSD